VTDEGMKEVARLTQLTELYLSGTAVTDKGLKALHGLQQLELLDVSRAKVTDAGVSELSKALPKCKIKR
jgi:internalin A